MAGKSQSQLVNPGNGWFLVGGYHWMTVFYIYRIFITFCKGVKIILCKLCQYPKTSFLAITEVSYAIQYKALGL